MDCPRMIEDIDEDLIIDCPSCDGMGVYDVGDSEEGIWQNCEECDGNGWVER